jgi:hypothetical protein
MSSLIQDRLKENVFYNEITDTTYKYNVLLIDSTVVESQLFYESVNEDTYPIIYSESSTKKELLNMLNDKFPDGFNRLCIVFHDPGYNSYKTFMDNKGLFLDSDLLENATIFSENTAFLIDLIKNKSVLKIDFLSCNTLLYPIWKQFYELLHLQTNVIVGASNDLTGNLKYGADWIMESTNEDIKNVYFDEETIVNYSSTLATTTLTNGGLQNGSFAYPLISYNTFQYITSSTTVPGWNFNNGVISNSSSGWNFPTPYPSGNQCLIIQGLASVSQLVYFPSGQITISFISCGRFYQTNNTVDIYINNSFVGSVTMYDSDWTNQSFNYNIPSAGAYTLSFNGNDNTGQSIAIQNIQILSGGVSLIETQTIYISQTNPTSNLSYSLDNNLWTQITNYPIAIANGSTNILTIQFITDITINLSTVSTNVFFYPISSNITFNGLKSNNNFCQITINGVTNYPGFFQNGTATTIGQNNITVQNFNTTSISSSLLQGNGQGGGYLCQGWFSNSATNNLIQNCSNSGAISSTFAGGVVGVYAGYNGGSITITNCSNSGAVSGFQSGGVVGAGSGYTNGTAIITNCSNSGAISGTQSGGVAGGGAAYSGTTIMLNCSNTGSVYGGGAGGIVGGVAGYTNGISIIQNCANYGTIYIDTSGATYYDSNYGGAGGVVGSLAGYQGTATIQNCSNSGTISGISVGGIVGQWFGANTNNICSISNCYNSGNISGTSVGGICGSDIGYDYNGSYYSTVNIMNCYSVGTNVTTCGGIVGNNIGNPSANVPIVTISKCYISN